MSRKRKARALRRKLERNKDILLKEARKKQIMINKQQENLLETLRKKHDEIINSGNVAKIRE